MVAAVKLVLVGFLFSQFPVTDDTAVADSMIIPNTEFSVKENFVMAKSENINQKDYVYLSDFRQQDQAFTDKDLAQLLYCVGFRGQNLKEAWAVAKKESNGRPLAYNGNAGTGDNSYGIFQINMIGNLGPDRRDKFELVYNRDLLDPVKNAEVAFYMSQQGDNWRSWKGLTPRTLEWMSKFPKFTPSPCKEKRKESKDGH